jgi:hypothetical protein
MTLTFGSATASAGLLYTYSRLTTKELEEMNQIVKTKIKESHSESGDKSIPLKEAMQAIFSRPNHDFMIEKILPPVRAELDDLNSWEKTNKALVTEALGALKNPKAFRPEAQVTYWIFLENWISENKPRAKDPFEKGILSQIRDAKIELSNEATKERKTRTMESGPSPSDLAARVLDAANPPAAPEAK